MTHNPDAGLPEEETQQVNEPLQFDEHWVLVQADPMTSLPVWISGKQILTYFLPWIGEDPMPERLMNACIRLGNNPPDWPGIQMKFTQDPSPGFVLNITKGWEPSNSKQEKDLFQKLIWEIQRVLRS